MRTSFSEPWNNNICGDRYLVAVSHSKQFRTRADRF